MDILLTGGAGFIGSHLVKALAAHQHINRIVVVDNLRRGDRSRLDGVSSKIEFLQADICDVEAIAPAFNGIEVVFHLAAEASVMGAVNDPMRSFTSNVFGTFVVLNESIRVGVKRFVFTSSREVYGEPEVIPVPETGALQPKNEYGASKVASETYCRLYQGKLSTVILRLANVYGKGDSNRVIPLFLERALQGYPLEIYGGQQLIDFIWVDDVVKALIRVGLDALPIDEPVNIGSGVGTSLQTLATRVIELVGTNAEVRVLPQRVQEVVRFVADTTRMKNLLGLQVEADPLYHLPTIIEPLRKAMFRISHDSAVNP